VLRFHVDHAASGNRGRRGNSEIVDFEKHGESAGESDTLAIGEAEHFGIIQDGVHAFDS